VPRSPVPESDPTTFVFQWYVAVPVLLFTLADCVYLWHCYIAPRLRARRRRQRIRAKVVGQRDAVIEEMFRRANPKLRKFDRIELARQCELEELVDELARGTR
jgi:hypothetical protein